jgi:hypothetical protein
MYSDLESRFGVYEDVIKEAGSEAIKVDVVNDALLDFAEKNSYEYFSKYVVASEFNHTSANTWILNALYSSTAIHSYPISVNMLSNTILRFNNLSHKISVTNHPLKIMEVSL